MDGTKKIESEAADNLLELLDRQNVRENFPEYRDYVQGISDERDRAIKLLRHWEDSHAGQHKLLPAMLVIPFVCGVIIGAVAGRLWW